MSAGRVSSCPGDLRPMPRRRSGRQTRLAALVAQYAVVHGRVTLSSGREADYYVDLRRISLHHEASPLVGRLLRELTADWDYAAVGGLTLGADPVATAMMHAAGRPLDAFVVRKAAKGHGLQRQVEGPDIAGRSVLVVEDTTTTGGSPMAAVAAVREVGADVVGVATILDRGGEAAGVSPPPASPTEACSPGPTSVWATGRSDPVTGARNPLAGPTEWEQPGAYVGVGPHPAPWPTDDRARPGAAGRR